jgi:hypothetical protein
MAAAPMDMLKRCREQFDRYAQEHRVKEARGVDGAADKAMVNEEMVRQIDATIQQWG